MRIGLSLLLISLLCGALCRPAWANKRDYARGVEAAESGEWAKVQELMGNALASDAEPKDRTLMYGTYRRPYIPQYYLALAALNNNDCPAAMRHLADARLGALLGSGGRAAAEATEVSKIRSRCDTSVVKSTTETPVKATPTPTPTPTLSAAQKQSAQTALAALARATTQAREKVALAQLSAALTRSAQATAALENAMLAAETTNLQRALQLASTATAELNRLAATAQAPVESAAPVKPSPIASAPAKAQAAAGLKTALTAFLSGDYQSVVRASTTGMDARSAGHTLLLRAAARYSLFLLSGEREAALRSQAETDVREARKTLAGIRPGPNYFSPRFVRFFEQTR